MSKHADTYIQAKAPKVKGAGVDRQANPWLLQGTSCDFDCHTGEVAWLATNTGTSGWGFHVGVEELHQVRARFEDYEDVDYAQLDKDTQSDDGNSRWDHLK